MTPLFFLVFGLLIAKLVTTPIRQMNRKQALAKTEMLGVPKEMIEHHGAVSLEVATAMADGAREHAGTTHALSVSGVAGPGGGSPEKPVGTVAFALSTPEHTYAQTILAPNWGRARIRLVSAAVALDMLRRSLNGLTVFARHDYAKTTRTETKKRQA